MAKLFFYYSAMNAGKSTTLVQSSYNYKERGMETQYSQQALIIDSMSITLAQELVLKPQLNILIKISTFLTI